jgi:hypothetical protein
MDVNYYLGINGKNCCIVKVPMRLTQDNVDEVMGFARYDATNWCGVDDIQRTCELQNYKLTDDIIKYNGKYDWTNLDHGHVYSGTFYFNRLIRVDTQ